MSNVLKSKIVYVGNEREMPQNLKKYLAIGTLFAA